MGIEIVGMVIFVLRSGGRSYFFYLRDLGVGGEVDGLGEDEVGIGKVV